MNLLSSLSIIWKIQLWKLTSYPVLNLHCGSANSLVITAGGLLSSFLINSGENYLSNLNDLFQT